MIRRNLIKCILSFVVMTLISMPLQAIINQKTNSLTDDSVKEGMIVAYIYPRISPKSSIFKVKAENQEVFVYQTSVGAFASFAFTGSITVEIETPEPIANIRISPARYGISPTKNGNKVSFQIEKRVNLLIEIEGQEQLYIYANAPDTNAPDPNAPGVHYFRAGQVYEVGLLRLHDNETLYIEGGAVVRGCIRATSAKNVRIAGPGILDGGYYSSGADSHRSIVYEDCTNSTIDDIIMINPSSWMIVLGICSNVTVNNVKELGAIVSTDGIDIVGSRHIRVENCFLRNGDDCIAIKSLDLRSRREDATLDFTADVEDVEVVGCSFLSYNGAAALEIGHELRTSAVSNIRFHDCDILGVHGFGAAFGIHNTDRAVISNILYENIRVEHYYNKLIDMRIIKSRYCKDEQRGLVHDIVFRNIDVTVSIYNPGYSISNIGGYDAEHIIKNVVFDNFRLNGVKVTNADQLDLFTKQVFGIKFK